MGCGGSSWEADARFAAMLARPPQGNDTVYGLRALVRGPGEAGKCGVRRNLDALRLVVITRRSRPRRPGGEEAAASPPGSDIFSIGTVGCNLRCAWCQNWDISQFRDFDPETDALGRRLMPQEIVDLCLRQGIPLVAFTYNEPAIYFEYAYDTAKLAHEAGLRTVMVSSGYETLQAIETIAPYLDAINVDLKAFDNETYRRYCGARLEPVLRNIRHLATESGAWVEVTTLVIPRLNDGDEELRHRRVLGRRQHGYSVACVGVCAALPHARPAAHFRGDAAPRLADRQGSGAALRVYRQRMGQPLAGELLRYAVPRVRRDADPARWVCCTLLVADAGRLSPVRRRHCRRVAVEDCIGQTRMKQERDMPEQSRAADEAGFVRRAAVAGRFYPADPATLEQMVRGFMREASPSRWEPPRAVIAPCRLCVQRHCGGSRFQALSRARRPSILST